MLQINETASETAFVFFIPGATRMIIECLTCYHIIKEK